MTDRLVFLAAAIVSLLAHSSNVRSQPACAAGTTSCIAGAPQKVSTCDASGAWRVADCPEWSLCTENRCTPVCDGLPKTVSGSVICFVPNKDGKNDGLLFLTNDVPRLSESGKEVTIVSSAGVSQLVRSGQAWPYAWLGLSPTAVIGFKLGRFGRPVHEVSIWVRNRRANQSSDVTRQFFSAKSSAPEAAFWTGFVSPPGLGWASATTFINSSPPAPTTAQFNYSDQTFNYFGWATAGDGDGHLGDVMLVNWMMLAIAP